MKGGCLVEKKKGRKKKIRFNYFLKRKIIIGICLFLVFVGGIVTVFALTNKDEKGLDNKQNEVDKTIPAECPYTLDELEELITTNWLFNDAYVNSQKSAEEFAFILMNFYNYFNKETDFIVWDEVDKSTWEPISLKKISYEQYQKNIQQTLNSCNYTLEQGGSAYFCITDLKLFMLHDAKFVEK